MDCYSATVSRLKLAQGGYMNFKNYFGSISYQPRSKSLTPLDIF